MFRICAGIFLAMKVSQLVLPTIHRHHHLLASTTCLSPPPVCLHHLLACTIQPAASKHWPGTSPTGTFPVTIFPQAQHLPLLTLPLDLLASIVTVPSLLAQARQPLGPLPASNLHSAIQIGAFLLRVLSVCMRHKNTQYDIMPQRPSRSDCCFMWLHDFIGSYLSSRTLFEPFVRSYLCYQFVFKASHNHVTVHTFMCGISHVQIIERMVCTHR